jgi:nitroreductase
MDERRLDMSVGEAIFTQRSIRRFRPDPIPLADLQLLCEAAVRAPNGGNRQIARLLVVTDRARIARFGELYHEAWWAKRRDEHGWTGPADVPPEATTYRAAMALADHMRDVPCVVLAFAEPPGWANSVLPACQNLMLAARALGIGSIPTTLHPTVMARVYALFGVPAEVVFHFCIPLGYPAEGARFGGSRRRPTRETTFFDHWGAMVPWA